MKVVSLIKMISFVVTILTSIPLFVSYLTSQAPRFQIITDLHVWFGAIFIVFAVTNMVMNKRAAKKS